MKNKKTMAVLAVAAVIITAGVIGIYNQNGAYAYQGDPARTGPNYSPERHAIMEKAFADVDYETWQEQMQGRGRVSEMINKDNFAQFAKAHQLAEEGKYEEANAIRAELGLGAHGSEGHMKGHGFGMRNGRKASGQRSHAAFIDANGDGICDNMQ